MTVIVSGRERPWRTEFGGILMAHDELYSAERSFRSTR
jgi:hypothetical protein